MTPPLTFRPCLCVPSSDPRQRIVWRGTRHSRAVPGYVLIADRNNDRVLLVSPSKRIVWQATGLLGPDDAFFTPGYRSIITNEEFDDTLTELRLRPKRVAWHYGHPGVPGSSRSKSSRRSSSAVAASRT